MDEHAILQVTGCGVWRREAGFARGAQQTSLWGNTIERLLPARARFIAQSLVVKQRIRVEGSDWFAATHVEHTPVCAPRTSLVRTFFGNTLSPARFADEGIFWAAQGLQHRNREEEDVHTV
jgi:hypothetical protein